MVARDITSQFLFKLPNDSPLQRFENYNRLTRKATIEALPVSIDAFIEQAADPQPAELAKFFEERKDRFQQPDSAIWLQNPARTSFQYFWVDFKSMIEVNKPRVSEAEIADYYEKKQIFVCEERIAES